MADPLTPPTTLADLPRVLALSARDPESLAELRRRLAAHLEQAPGTGPDDVALTLQTGRERFSCRDAVVADRTDDLVRLLRERSADGTCPARTAGDGPVLVLDGSPCRTAAVDLPEVADALRLAADTCRDGGDADTDAARTVAVQYGVAAWLRARRVAFRAVRGEGLGALAAAAMRSEVPLSEALRAAAAGVSLPAAVDALLPAAAGASLPVADADADRAVPYPDAPVVRIGVGRPDTPGELVLDPADGASCSRLLAELWRLGFDVDTTLGRPGRRVRLPGHPFRRRDPGGAGPAGSTATRPLTPYEQRWLFYDMVRQGSSGDHTVAAAAALPGPPPPPDALAAAFAELQRRHPALRTVFSEPGGRWQARTLPAPAARPHHLVPAPDGVPHQLRQTVRDAARQPLRLRDAPLVRCCVQSGPAHWAVSLAVYEPLTAAADPQQLLDELVGLVGAEVPEPEPAVESRRAEVVEAWQAPAVEPQGTPAVGPEPEPAVEAERGSAVESRHGPAVEPQDAPVVGPEPEPAVESRRAAVVGSSLTPAVESQGTPAVEAGHAPASESVTGPGPVPEHASV
ncbi:hypothetical protein ABTY98_28580 [Streptomyces sp. NPDC096040]|uniref:CurL C-terminal domain-containing protein n=1 Tax=Streptomyces sp. NPDC096040 TaxID=3155541 RepID=UPI00331F0C9A